MKKTIKTKTSPVKKQKLSLKAEKRNVFGRKLKKLRQQGVLPANIYGKKIKSQALKINQKDFLAVYSQAGETGIVELNIAKTSKPHHVLIHNLQVDPVHSQPLHVDFRKIDLKEKVQVQIPIELIGQSPAESKGGVLVHLLNEVEVKALPADLPDKFEVDISVLKEIGQSISLKDIKIDKSKIEILAELSQLVVKVEEPRKEEEEEEKKAEEKEEAGEEKEKAEEKEEAKTEKQEEKNPAEAEKKENENKAKK